MARISKEKQEEIYKKIKEVAKEKFDTLGYEKTSTKVIAKEVGIAEGTLFNYFDSKSELFFEVFGDEYKEYLLENKDNIPISDNIGEILLSHTKKVIGFVFKVPRSIIGELTIATIKMAKKHPDRFKKLAQYDFDFIDDLTHYIERLVDLKIIREVNPRQMSEIIFSAISYELLMYVNDHSLTKEDVYKNIKTKIDILVKGYLIGGEK